MAESTAEPLQASTVEIPTSAQFNGKIIAGTLAGLTIPALFAASGGKGGKGSDTNTQQQTKTTATANPSEQTTANNPVTNSQTAAKPTPVTENKAPEPAVKTDTATTEKPSEKPAVNKPVSDGQNAAKPTVPATENKAPAPAAKTDIAATEKPSEKPAVSNGQTTTPSDTPLQPEPVRYTSKFTLSNGLSFSIESENQAADIKLQGYQDSLRPLTQAEARKLAAESSISIQKADDRDGDGLIDSVDKHPDYWNVSDRDLRMFATLAYATEGKSTLQQALSGHYGNSIEINSVKANFNGQVDISEYQGHWEVLNVTSKGEVFGSGLDYVIFGNGKKDDNSYENVVVAFRGTKGLQDGIADIKLALGSTPTQAKELTEIIGELEKYKPDHIFSTGHSLGGYLAQYFAAHTVQNSEFKDEFVRSVLFNPAKITVDGKMLQLSEYFSQQRIYDAKFAHHSNPTYKTNSYVINKEWLADGFVETDKNDGIIGSFLGWLRDITVGLVFNGLGKYSNSIILKETNLDGSSWDRHALANFFEINSEIQKYFSQGYRIDNQLARNYQSIDSDSDGLTDYQELLIGTNPKKADSDGDGFSDGIEVKLQADALAKDDMPIRPEALYEHAQTLALKAETQSSDGLSQSDSAVLLAEVDKTNGEIAYRADDTVSAPSDSPLTLSGITLIHGTAGNDTITGSSSNDRIHGGLGSDRLIGGEGSDTFVFDKADIADGHTDTLADFNAAFDKLDFSGMKDWFSDGRGFNFNWAEVLVEGVQNDTARAYLVFDSGAQTLAYQAKGSDAATVFARFEGENVHLGADQMV